MLRHLNIVNFTKAIMIVLSAMFLLSACTSGTSNDEKLVAVQPNQTAKDLEAAQVECWQEKIVIGLYDLMGKTTVEMYDKVTKGAMAFMMVAFAVWFAFRIFAHVTSFVEENPAEVWTEVIRKFAVCFVCGLIASSPGFIMEMLNLTVFPIYGAFLEFGSEILARASGTVYTYSTDTSGLTLGNVATTGGALIGSVAGPVGTAVGAAAGASASAASGQGDLMLFGEKITWWTSGYPVVCNAGPMDHASVTGFPEMPKKMMSCLICSLNQRMNLGFSLSFEVMKVPGITPTLVGLMILICFTLVKLGFVFYLMDTIFKFAVIIVILPILIMAYAFKYTRGWLSKGILTILNSSAFMMFIAVVMAMAMSAIEDLIKNNPEIFNPSDDQAMTVVFQEFSIPFMCLLMIAFLIASSVGVAQQLTDSLVGGSSDSKAVKKLQGALKASVNFVLGLFTGGASLAVQKYAWAAKMASKYNNAKQKVRSGLGMD